MSFVILLLIMYLVYACLATYRSVFPVVLTLAIIFGMTAAFLVYGLYRMDSRGLFVILDTEINRMAFIHVCAVWFASDIVCARLVIKKYRDYLALNAKIRGSVPEQA